MWDKPIVYLMFNFSAPSQSVNFDWKVWEIVSFQGLSNGIMSISTFSRINSSMSSTFINFIKKVTTLIKSLWNQLNSDESRIFYILRVYLFAKSKTHDIRNTCIIICQLSDYKYIKILFWRSLLKAGQSSSILSVMSKWVQLNVYFLRK